MAEYIFIAQLVHCNYIYNCLFKYKRKKRGLGKSVKQSKEKSYSGRYRDMITRV